MRQFACIKISAIRSVAISRLAPLRRVSRPEQSRLCDYHVHRSTFELLLIIETSLHHNK